MSLIASLALYVHKKNIPALGFGETAVRIDFGLNGILWAVKSTSGLKLRDGQQLPVHIMYCTDGACVMGPRDLEAGVGTRYEEAWRASMHTSICERLGLKEEA